MSLNKLVESSKKYFPDLKIEFKENSKLMKFFGKLSLNKRFNEDYTTIIGSTVYFPNESFIKIRPVSSGIILLHELFHLNDSKKWTYPLFMFLYCSPQSFSLLCLPLLFISWKFLFLLLLLLTPIPSFFRTYFEKRAYFSSMYVIYRLSKVMNFNHDLDIHRKYFVDQFKGNYYYYMFPFSTIDKSFSIAQDKITNGERPFEDPFFDVLDELVLKM